MSINETETLLIQADSNTLLGVRDSAIMETLYSAGMRVSELVGIDVADVDFFNGVVKVKEKVKRKVAAYWGSCIKSHTGVYRQEGVGFVLA